MKTLNQILFSVTFLLAAITPAARAAGTWAPLVNPPPGPAGHFLLLTDGSVMAENLTTNYGPGWFRLVPDSHGSYASGTWTNIAPMKDTRLDFGSIVLTNGNVLVFGGEYGGGDATSEIYNPVANTWTTVSVPTNLLNPALNSTVFATAQGFVDPAAMLLKNGNVLVSPVGANAFGQTMIYNVVSNIWQAGPLTSGLQAEASWIKLPDDSILTVDFNATTAERYLPAGNNWVADGSSPVALYDAGGEIGPGMLLPNGKAIFFGATSNTAIYTPSGTSSPGTWVAGPNIPKSQGMSDAPAAMLVNGKVLCTVGHVATNGTEWAPPVTFYEYDYVSNTFASVAAPLPGTNSVYTIWLGGAGNSGVGYANGGGTNFNDVQWPTLMLDLPDGTVLFGHRRRDFYIYQPDGIPLAAGKPTITAITTNANGSLHLTGTMFNGLCQGATYGDDEQMDSNFPIVKFTDSGGTVRFGRTFNWSRTGVQTSNAVVSTDCTIPAGASSQDLIQVIANGIASDGSGNIVTITNDNGPGSLRQIVASASVGATITFATNLAGKTIMLTNGEIALNNNITIDGTALAKPILLNGNHSSRLFNIGGGVSATLNSLVITNGFPGAGGWGGAIANGGTLTMNNCTVAGNSCDAAGAGGAIQNGGALALNGCTLYNNSGGFAGAINNNASCSAANCTFYGNNAVNGNGGAIDNAFGPSLSLLHCTFYGNTAAGNGGDVDNYSSQLYVTNSILAASAPDDIYTWANATNTAGGSNIVQELGNNGGLFGANTILMVNPLLGPFANNGGLTLTLLPQSGSPAINAGVSSAAAGLATDQRGFPRLLGAAVDIGAVESLVLPITFNGNGGYWSANQSGTYTTPTLANNVLRLTDGSGYQARSVFFQLPQYIGAFKASFTYQLVSGSADGVAFVLQNDPRGKSALGGNGGSLGYGLLNPITPSAALELNIYNAAGIGYAFLNNGATGDYHAPGAINLASGHPIGVTLNYANSQLSLMFNDSIAGLSFSTNLNVGNLTNLVGGATAYVGFTGSDGGFSSTQIISDFSFVSIPMETVSLAAGQLLISWPSAVSGYTLQQNSNLNTTNWVSLTNQATILSGQNQISLPLTRTNEFYRLMLP